MKKYDYGFDENGKFWKRRVFTYKTKMIVFAAIGSVIIIGLTVLGFYYISQLPCN
jgi:hypothetical protein